MLQTWAEVFTASFQNLYWGLIQFLPNLIVALIVFVIAWVLGGLVGRALEQVIGALKIDSLFLSAGVGEFFDKLGVKFSLGAFFGWLFRWFIVVGGFMMSLDFMHLDEVNAFLTQNVLLYLKNVIVAALVLVIATVLADFVGKVVATSAKAADLASAKFFGTVTRYAIFVFGLIIAISELGVGVAYLQFLFQGVVLAVAIATGLAFGLGGKDAAARAIEHVRGQTRD